MRDLRSPAALAFALLLISPCVSTAAVFTGLGDLPGGAYYSKATGVSADGSTVVGYARAGNDSHYEAFRWTFGGGIAPLGDLPGGNAGSRAYDCSADGTVIVGRTMDASGTHACRWVGGAAPEPLADIAGGRDDWSSAYGCSDDGGAVAGKGDGPDGGEAFRHSGGVTAGLGRLHAASALSDARGLSADGLVAVGYSINEHGHEEAFRWTAGGMNGLGNLAGEPSADSRAVGCSADGSVIVGRSKNADGVWEAFRWTAGGMSGLGLLDAAEPFSRAEACSADGSVVVGMSRVAAGAGTKDRAFVWDAARGMRLLADVLAEEGAPATDWTLAEAVAVSADGHTLVGNGINPAGEVEAWVAIIPEPTTLALLAVGLPFVTRGPRTRRCR